MSLNRIDMDDCSKHKKEVAGISDMKLLAEMIGDLNYESLNNFLAHLSLKIRDDANKDYVGNREKLATELHIAADCIGKSREAIAAAWKISKPFMESKK